MPVKLREIAGGRGLVFAYSGTLTVKDTDERLRLLLEHPERLPRLYFILVDFSDCDSLQFTQEEIKLVAEQDKALRNHLPAGFVVAIIAVRDLQYGLARMWQTYVEESGVTSAICRTAAEAETWLREAALRNHGEKLPSFLDELSARR